MGFFDLFRKQPLRSEPVAVAPAPVVLSAERRCAIASEVVAAERAGGSHWVEGAAVAERHGVSIFDVHDEYMALLDAEESEPEIIEEVVSLDADTLIDLRGIEAVRMRVKGTYVYVAHADRLRVRGKEFVLVREPSNEHDAMAVAVHTMNGRKIGYVSASRASMMAPLLDRLGASGYLVGGAGATDTNVTVWVDIPKVAALRGFVAARV